MENEKQKRINSKKVNVIFFVCFFINILLTIFNIKTLKDNAVDNVVKYKKIHKELSVQDFIIEPEYKEFAWDSENIPLFIMEDFEKAIKNSKYDGVEYSYGENKIRIQEECCFSDYESSIMVNYDLDWELENWSIYYSGDKIVIYGYWNDEFRKIVIGKEENDIEKSILTVDPEIPLSANSLFKTEIADKYILVVGEDQHTVSAYKNKKQIGEDFYIDEKVIGSYNRMLLTEAHGLYMPYVLKDDEFTCVNVARLTSSDIISSTEVFGDYFYGLHFYMYLDGLAFPVLQLDNYIAILIPNEIKQYEEYMSGDIELSNDNDLQWHWEILD